MDFLCIDFVRSMPILNNTNLSLNLISVHAILRITVETFTMTASIRVRIIRLIVEHITYLMMEILIILLAVSIFLIILFSDAVRTIVLF